MMTVACVYNIYARTHFLLIEGATQCIFIYSYGKCTAIGVHNDLSLVINKVFFEVQDFELVIIYYNVHTHGLYVHKGTYVVLNS